MDDVVAPSAADMTQQMRIEEVCGSLLDGYPVFSIAIAHLRHF